jgi:putative transposase
MARLPRLHVNGGLYYVLLRGNGGEPIFSDDSDRAEFSRLVAAALRRCNARLHAYCWMTNDVRLALQVSEVPVGRFVQRVAGQHSRRMHRKLGRSGHLFERGYRTLLVEPEKYLPELVRHIHCSVLEEGLDPATVDEHRTSHAAYLQRVRLPWLTMTTLLRQLQIQYGDAAAGYRRLMNPEELRDAPPSFDHGSPQEPRVLGDAQFIASLPAPVTGRSRVATLDQLIDGVVAAQDIAYTDLMSSSRRSSLVLARGLIAWYATHHRVATLAETARRLNRDPSTLLVAIERYKRLQPALFERPIEDVVNRNATAWRSMVRRTGRRE